MFKVGDRVYYVSGAHGQSSINPKKGSEYECQGTIIIRNGTKHFPVMVRWDNGRENSYSSGDLRYAKGDRMGPNLAFRLKKLKRR